MKHIVYLSRAVHPLTDQGLQQLLAQCRRDNALHGITGVLFYSHGNIAQLFEGETDQVDPLFDRISCDGRHSHVRKLIDKSITARSFTDWHMAFHPLEPSGFDALQGFLLPHHIIASPSSLSIADAVLLDLVRLAVFGPDVSTPYHDPGVQPVWGDDAKQAMLPGPQ